MRGQFAQLLDLDLPLLQCGLDAAAAVLQRVAEFLGRGAERQVLARVELPRAGEALRKSLRLSPGAFKGSDFPFYLREVGTELADAFHQRVQVPDFNPHGLQQFVEARPGRRSFRGLFRLFPRYAFSRPFRRRCGCDRLAGRRRLRCDVQCGQIRAH